MMEPAYRIASPSQPSMAISNPIRICALRISFLPDDDETTTGTGQFLTTVVDHPCDEFVVDPAPHNRAYFQDHIRSLANYYQTVSDGKVNIDTLNSTVFPLTDDSSFQVGHAMAYYHPFLVEDSVDLRLSELLVDAVQAADPVVDFSQFDLVVVFHAGVGQDFAITLDPTPYDIPSAYMNKNDLKALLSPGDPDFEGLPVENGTAFVTCGLILPESQNHLLYDNYEEVFGSGESVCEYQFGLNGTFAFTFGFFLGLPSLYNTETGYTGIGRFGLMDQGSANLNGLVPSVPNAWERVFLGWETPAVVGKFADVSLEKAGSGAGTTVWKIPINSHEYFLIENRCAWFRPGVSLDSLQYQIYMAGGEKNWPSAFPLIRDTLKAVFSTETGVMLSVPHYDYGIPGSGLLIWHIDETIINANLSTNRVNVDRDRRGVDLEEGDGAQDLGYDADILNEDVEDGWFFDPWFAGNDGFIDLNPEYELDAEKRVGFTPYTNPSSCSNSFAFTGIYVDSIGPAGETMTFRITLKNALDNFPLIFASQPEEILPIDLNPADQTEEILVIGDSLWIFSPDGERVAVSPADSINVISDSLILYGLGGESLSARQLAADGQIMLIDTLYMPGWQFYGRPLPVKTGLLSAAQNSARQNFLIYYQPELHTVSAFSIDESIEKIIGGDDNLFAATSDERVRRIRLDPFSAEVVSNLPKAGDGTLATAFINADTFPDLIHCSDSLLTLILDIGSDNETTLSKMVKLNGNLALADLDGDGKIEIIVAGSNQIYAYNEELTLESNFPVSLPFILGGDQFGVELLSADLDGDDNGDIIINTSAALLAFNYKGELLENFPKVVDSSPKPLTGMLFNTPHGLAYLAAMQADGAIDYYNRLMATIITSHAHETGDWICYGGGGNRQFYCATASQSGAVEDETLLDQARTFNWPNPVKDDHTFIRYFPNHNCDITITVYDLAGSLIASFKDSAPLIGEPNEKEWNTAGVASGVYFAVVKAKSGAKSESKIVKILVVN